MLPQGVPLATTLCGRHFRSGRATEVSVSHGTPPPIVPASTWSVPSGPCASEVITAEGQSVLSGMANPVVVFHVTDHTPLVSLATSAPSDLVSRCR
jgi:hypothetical protein